MLKLFVTVLAIGCVLGANDPNCGTKGPATTQYVVGGANTTPLEFPWQVSLQVYSAASGWYHTCGASIISNRWILTAAHCVDRAAGTQYRAILGEHNRNINEGTELTLAVDRVIIQPTWDSARINNDVAVLRLNQTLDFNGAESRLNPVCLPTNGEAIDQIANTDCIATGWGNTQWQGSSPAILQKVTVSIWTQQTCVTRYASVHPITTAMICFGENGKGTCQGDSGGPLNCQVGGRWYSYGATSFGVQCAGPTYPSASARNSQFSNWIWAQVDAN